MRLANKVGIVTAAASGMGRAGALRFAQEGAAVAVVDLDEAGANAVVKQITDDTNMTVWTPPIGNPAWPTVSGLTGWRMGRAFAINDTRGMALWGNAIKLDRGSYLGVGDGTLYVNGATLAGSSLSLSRQPKIALFDPTASTYTDFTLGMITPAAPSLAAVGGGSKMQGGNYSFVITPARKETFGFNNPSDRADVTISTNDMIACTFPAMDTANGQDAWIVWGTTFADTLGADLNYLNGPWHRIRMVTDDEVSPAGGTVNFEYYDAEIETNEIVSFNNDPPVEAVLVVYLNDTPVWISCQGQGFATHPEATSPGPFIVPSKPNNIEAAPLDLAFSSSPPETILGAVEAQGRIYLLTTNKLQIAQSTPSDVVPILIRPFWHSGFANPEQVIFVNGRLFGFPLSGPTRSAGDGDESYIEHEWASDIYEITKYWNRGQVMLGLDPRNDAVIFFHIADRLNSAGFWTTKWIAYGMGVGDWIGAGEIGAEGDTNWDTRDHIVSGVATVQDDLVLLISGRQT